MGDIVPTPRLRRPAVSDLEAYHAFMSDERMWAFHPTERHTDIGQTHRFLAWIDRHWEQHGFGYWSVEDGTGAVGVGGVCWIGDPADRLLNGFYQIRPESQGQGYATFVLRASVDLAHDRLNGASIELHVHRHNEPSIAVGRKCGFERAKSEPADDQEMLILRRDR